MDAFCWSAAAWLYYLERQTHILHTMDTTMNFFSPVYIIHKQYKFPVPHCSKMHINVIKLKKKSSLDSFNLP